MKTEPDWKTLALKAYMVSDHLLGHTIHQPVCSAIGLCECGLWKAENYFTELRNQFGTLAPKLLYPEREEFIKWAKWPEKGD
jgi:hypothetical protein